MESDISMIPYDFVLLNTNKRFKYEYILRPGNDTAVDAVEKIRGLVSPEMKLKPDTADFSFRVMNASGEQEGKEIEKIKFVCRVIVPVTTLMVTCNFKSLATDIDLDHPLYTDTMKTLHQVRRSLDHVNEKILSYERGESYDPLVLLNA